MDIQLQVVIPMAGLGSRFTNYGFKVPKYLLPINAALETMIEKAIASLGVSVPCTFLYILREEDGEDTELRTLLDTVSKKYHLSYKIYCVSQLTEGPASTVYAARSHLDPSLPLLVSNSDQVLSWDFSAFHQACQAHDGCVLTYTPDYELTLGSTDKHSFLRLDEHQNVVECREKIVLSEKALVGVHYFTSAQCFLDAYTYMKEHDMRAPNGEFYMSLSYQAMLEMGKSVGYYDITLCQGVFYPVGEPEDYFAYLYQHGGFHDSNS